MITLFVNSCVVLCYRFYVCPCRINPKDLEYVSYGKPNPFVFKNAEAILSQLQLSSCLDHSENNGVPGSHPFETLYMIGDNPSVDVKGAQQVCLHTPCGSSRSCS